jgi:uncharacterized protein YndB with AHSA1/START domain
MSQAASDSRTLVIERTLAHPPEKVWRALTERELLARWVMPNDFEPVAGRRFALRAEPSPHWNGVVQCEVLALDPPRRLAMRWGDGTPEGGHVATTVVWTLTPAEGGTRLRLEQSGFGPADTRNRQGAEFGWNRMLDALPAVIAEIG